MTAELILKGEAVIAVIAVLSVLGGAVGAGLCVLLEYYLQRRDLRRDLGRQNRRV